MGGKNSELWFQACIEDDIDFVKKYHSKCIGLRETRDELNKYFSGFTGLLYACYYNSARVADFLFPHE